MGFLENVKSVLNNENHNVSITENGAVGYKTTGKELLDMSFKVSSMRNWTDDQIEEQFRKVYFENPVLAIKFLFYAADVRQGMGERRLFRVCYKELTNINPSVVEALIPYVAEYTRWDNLFVLLRTKNQEKMLTYVRDQLDKDVKDMQENKPISLLAKWMPGHNTRVKEKRKFLWKFLDFTGLSIREYTHLLSKLRRYLDVVELKTSENNWGEINYESVPSRANLKYKDAFLKHDHDRRTAYLESLTKGEAKINAGVLYPHDIVWKYFQQASHGYSIRQMLSSVELDPAVEGMWNALPDTLEGKGAKTMLIVDGSGSMYNNKIGNTGIPIMTASQALAIYFSNKVKGEFHNKFITFSRNPQIVDISNGKTLLDKIKIISDYDECANTNIEAVFDLLLETAVTKNLSQDDMPENLLILSDMEFDTCVETGTGRMYGDGEHAKHLFKSIELKYLHHEFRMPKLIFWNINSRTGTIPVNAANKGGLSTILVSGYSVNTMKMVLSEKTDPFDALLEALNTERYQPIEDAVKDLV